jgi:hypothetical protein
VSFWDRLVRRNRHTDPSQNIPPQQSHVDPGSASLAPDPGHEHGGQSPEDPAQSADPAESGDPAEYGDPGQPGDTGAGDGGGGDSGGGGDGGGGGNGGGGGD